MKIGQRVKLRPDVLRRHARSVPAHAGFTTEQFKWREILGEYTGQIGIVTRLFTNSKHVNVEFGDGKTIGIDYTELDLVT